MTRTLLLVLVLSASVSAQTVERVIDLSAFGWGNIDTPTRINTDGNPYTAEWLVRSSDTSQIRVVAERNGGLCVGAWFRPGGINPLTGVTLDQNGPYSLLLLRTYPSPVVTVMRLDTPECQ